MSISLEQVYSHPSVEAFGKALRASLRFDQDFSSLIDLENAETNEAIAEALKKFLRRNYKSKLLPTEQDLKDLAKLIDEAGARVVRTALISHALVWDSSWGTKKEAEPEQTKE